MQLARSTHTVNLLQSCRKPDSLIPGIGSDDRHLERHSYPAVVERYTFASLAFNQSIAAMDLVIGGKGRDEQATKRGVNCIDEKMGKQ